MEQDDAVLALAREQAMRGNQELIGANALGTINQSLATPLAGGALHHEKRLCQDESNVYCIESAVPALLCQYSTKCQQHSINKWRSPCFSW